MTLLSGRLWFVFGSYSDSHTDIADRENSTLLEHVPEGLAWQIVEAHNKAIQDLEEQAYAYLAHLEKEGGS